MCIVTFDLRRENRRHDNCTCTVEYISGGQKQNVHTKALSPFTEEDRRRIKELTAGKGTSPLTAYEAKDIEQRVRSELAGRSGGELTRAAKSDIMKSEEVRPLEQAKKRDHKIFITDTAIERIDRVKPSDFSDQQADEMMNMHKKLLKIAKDENDSNEVLIITGLDFSSEVTIKGGEFMVSPASNPFAVSVIAHAERQSLLYLHNHPSTNIFSIGDIDTFCCEKAIKTMSVVTNQGEVYILNKTANYSFEVTKKLLTDIFESFPEGEIDDKVFVNKYLKDCYKGGVEYVKAK